MVDSEKYIFEINRFKETFYPYIDKKIVLYGIGRYTATLLPHIREYNIVGLLDRKEESIGKKIEGIPVISLKEAETTADMIIINTTSIYWRIIYERIYETSLPVYFLNGELATKESKQFMLNIEFTSEEAAKERISKSDLITFDFFDTLFLRQCFSLDDIFLLVEKRLINEGYKVNEFAKIRQKAAIELHGENSTIDEIYSRIAENNSYSTLDIELFKKAELDVQKELLLPRQDVLELLKYAILNYKEVKIVSDMYLPASFLQTCLQEWGVDIKLENIYVSCELKRRKADGTLWKKIKEESANKVILHFGDNPNGDIDVPKKLGISSILIPNVRSIADAYGFVSIAGEINNLYQSIIYAQVINKLFNSGLSSGSISDNYTMGYCVFGPLFLTYLLWLLKEKRRYGYKKYFFFSRDGYFLIRDYEYLKELLNIKNDDSCYLCVSRYVSMLTEAFKNHNYENLIEMPYTGNPVHFLRRRFLVEKDLDKKYSENLGINDKKEIYEQNKKDIERVAYQVSNDYLNYVRTQDISSEDALVDFSFRGSNQHYLCEILQLELPGYYFFADKSDGNIFAANQVMYSCFQSESDKSASESNVRKNALVIESLLTAPYGMITRVYSDGTIECDDDRNNQHFFGDKEEINEGAKRFMSDLIKLHGADNLFEELNPLFIDGLYGCLMSGNIEISKRVKNSFYYDNGMFHDMDNPIFE